MKSSTYIKLTEEEVDKLNLCSRSMEDHPSKSKIIHGLIDVGTVTAIKTLQNEGLLTQSELDYWITTLPEFHRRRIEEII